MTESLSKSTGLKQDNLPLTKKILFLAIPFLIFLGMTEGVLRLTVGLKQLRYKCHYPILDNQYCPNIEAVHEKTGKIIRTNSDGLLGHDYPKERVPGTFRIAVLGDSFTAGEEVEDGFEFHALWEKELPKAVGFPVEVINFGVGGIGPWKELQTFHLRVREYKPDLTVLALYWENDFDNSITKLKKGELNPLKDEYPVASLKERLQVIRKNINQWLWNNIALYQFTHTRYHMLEHQFHLMFEPEWRETPKPEEKEEKTTEKNLVTGVDNPLLKEYPALPGVAPASKPKVDMPTVLDDPFFWDSESWDLVRKLLQRLKEEVEQEGGRLMVIHFMSEIQYAERHPLPTQQFDTFLQKNGIAVVDPNPLYLKMSKQELAAQYVPDDIHFNEAGHAVLARASMETLSKLVKQQAQRSPYMKP